MAKTTWLIDSDELKKEIDSRHLTYQAAANLAGISHAILFGTFIAKAGKIFNIKRD